MSELFATNAPDPHHWTLNSCFDAFRKVWVHLGKFRYCTKLGAKWAVLVQLMQKFMPRSCVGTFRYERTRNTPLDPKLMFCVFRNVWVHLGLFHYNTKLSPKWDELVQLMQIFMPRSGIRIFRFERTRSTQTNPKLMFWCVS